MGWVASCCTHWFGWVCAWVACLAKDHFVEGECGKTLVQHYIVLLITAKLVCSWYPNLQHQKDREETLVDWNLGQSKCSPSLAIKKQLHEDQNKKGGKKILESFCQGAMHCYSSRWIGLTSPLIPTSHQFLNLTHFQGFLASVPKLTPKYQQLSTQYYRRSPWNPIATPVGLVVKTNGRCGKLRQISGSS